eukprot:364557-Chlamydomonas_euryale.AAC.24
MSGTQCHLHHKKCLFLHACAPPRRTPLSSLLLVGLVTETLLVPFTHALKLFMGELKGRCATPDFSNATIGPDDVYSGVTYNVPEDNQQPLSQVCKGPAGLSITWTQDHVTGLPVSSAANGGWSHVGGISWGFACPYEPTDNPNFPNYPHGQFCVPWGNPGIGGYWNFDNILMSWVSIYQHMAVNDWSFIMYATQVRRKQGLWGSGFTRRRTRLQCFTILIILGALSWWTWLLHVTAVILGCFFLVNLTLAVIFMAFNQHYSPNGSTNEHDAGAVLLQVLHRKAVLSSAWTLVPSTHTSSRFARAAAACKSLVCSQLQLWMISPQEWIPSLSTFSRQEWTSSTFPALLAMRVASLKNTSPYIKAGCVNAGTRSFEEDGHKQQNKGRHSHSSVTESKRDEEENGRSALQTRVVVREATVVAPLLRLSQVVWGPSSDGGRGRAGLT